MRRPALLAALVLAVSAAACGGTLPSDRTSASGDPDPSAAADPTRVPTPGHETYGFVPYWEMDDGIAAHLADTDLTTVALFSVTHRRSGELATNQNGYRRITGDVGQRVIREARERGTRVEIVYSSFGPQKNTRFYTEPDAQARWIEELVDLVVDLGIDGVNVDVESLPVEHLVDYGAFVGRLRAALRERVPDGQVSVATQGNARGAAMAAEAAAAGADRIFLMGYDYHWEGSGPGASAPIDRYDGDDADLVWSLDLYAGLGVPVERTILGLPLYGMTWPVEGPDLGAFATGRGDEWVPRLNLRVFEAPGFTPTYEPIESVEFYAVQRPPEASTSVSAGPSASAATAGDGQWHAVYYDSPRSLAPKLRLADERGLAGVGFWAIGYERGLPGYGELLSTFRAGELRAP
ncbi:MAG: glycosyl hydrolase family 18 protein [Candidatus Limnocylindrales bacterium]